MSGLWNKVNDMPETYTGDVTVGGPPQTRDLGALTLTKVQVGPMENNAYFLRCSESGQVLLIDAAHSPDVLLGILDNQRPQRIVTTGQRCQRFSRRPAHRSQSILRTRSRCP
jgi:hypothetical protein